VASFVNACSESHVFLRDVTKVNTHHIPGNTGLSVGKERTAEGDTASMRSVCWRGRAAYLEASLAQPESPQRP
jgi:hypothetical protein